jgi:hypothetical protein
MADRAADFILSKINVSTGTRDHSSLVETQYEIPRAAIAEAVINALAHRDYYSKGSVQIAVFTDRIEIENPGRLPDEITVEDLKKVHSSYPHNSLLANCLFLIGAIERFGTGTTEMVDKIADRGLAEPVFVSRNSFKVVIWRKLFAYRQKGKVRVQDRVQDGVQVSEQILQMIRQIHGEMSASELMDLLSLKARRNFTENYLQPSIMQGYIEMSEPDKPTLKTQTYRLTTNGLNLKTALIAASSTQEIPDATDHVTDQVIEYVTDRVTDRVTDQVTNQVHLLILAMGKENTRQELMKLLELKHNQTFRKNYLHPALEGGWIEMTIPEKPNDPKQKYRLTPKGIKKQKHLKTRN